MGASDAGAGGGGGDRGVVQGAHADAGDDIYAGDDGDGAALVVMVLLLFVTKTTMMAQNTSNFYIFPQPLNIK